MYRVPFAPLPALLYGVWFALLNRLRFEVVLNGLALVVVRVDGANGLLDAVNGARLGANGLPLEADKLLADANGLPPVFDKEGVSVLFVFEPNGFVAVLAKGFAAVLPSVAEEVPNGADIPNCAVLPVDVGKAVVLVCRLLAVPPKVLAAPAVKEPKLDPAIELILGAIMLLPVFCIVPKGVAVAADWPNEFILLAAVFGAAVELNKLGVLLSGAAGLLNALLPLKVLAPPNAVLLVLLLNKLPGAVEPNTLPPAGGSALVIGGLATMLLFKEKGFPACVVLKELKVGVLWKVVLEENALVSGLAVVPAVEKLLVVEKPVLVNPPGSPVLLPSLLVALALITGLRPIS